MTIQPSAPCEYIGNHPLFPDQPSLAKAARCMAVDAHCFD